VLRAITPSAETLERSVMMSSLDPVAEILLLPDRRSCWAKPARRRWRACGARRGGGRRGSLAPTRSPTLATPSASRGRPDRQSADQIGALDAVERHRQAAPSTRSCTSLRSARARSASDCTHSDFTAWRTRSPPRLGCSQPLLDPLGRRLGWAGSWSSRQTPYPSARRASVTA